MGRTTAQQAEWAESHLLFNIMEVYFCHGIKKVIVTFFLTISSNLVRILTFFPPFQKQIGIMRR